MKRLGLMLGILLLFGSCRPIEEQLGLGNQPLRIAIQPLGKTNPQLLADIQRALQEAYAAEVTVLPGREMYREAFVHIKSPRYRADSLLKFLKRDMPREADYIIGVTGFDISTTKYEKFPDKIKEPEYKYRDWGVFGLGTLGGKSCVVSTFRAGGVTREKLSDRMQKISIHEIGHNMGLRHCPDISCVMTDAVESIRTVDQAQKELCSVCRKQI